MMGLSPLKTSVDVERNAEDQRAHLAQTLDQLRENLKPENVVDEVMTNAKFGAANLADTLWKVARDNPIPALLIGAGVALVLGLGARRSVPTGIKGSFGGRSRDAGDLGKEAVMPVGARSVPINLHNRSGASLGDAGRPPRGPVGDASTEASPRPSASGPVAALDASLSDIGGSIGPKLRRLSLGDMLHDQPLMLGAAGLAVGIAIGASLPVTRTEEEWMGETSASVKHAAQDAAQAQLFELKAAAGRAVDQVRQSATEHGLSAENFNDLVRDVGGHAKAAVHDIGGRLDPGRRAS
jgi:ElaB/YqjD/DUF883 family membrane-anchored ribosome-binding protein